MRQSKSSLPARVRKALIPCGGKGTRMLGVTGGRPKEMIEVAGVPVVERVVQECGRSGIEEVLVVLAPGKDEIRRHLDALAGKPGFPRSFLFTEQKEARGLADAIRMGRSFAGDEVLAVALPDNLFLSDPPALAQVIEGHVEAGRSAVAVVEISEIDAARRGPTPVLPGVLEGAAFHIERVPDKGSREGRFDTGGQRSAYTAVGRYVFTPEALAAIDEVEAALPPGAEIDDVPLMQLLVRRGQLIGRHVRGRFLDVGLPEGFAEANTALAGG